MSATSKAGRDGDLYHVTPEEVERFRSDGYVHFISMDFMCRLCALCRHMTVTQG